MHLNQIKFLDYRPSLSLVCCYQLYFWRGPSSYTCQELSLPSLDFLSNAKHKKLSRNFSISKTGGHNDEKLFERGKSSNPYIHYTRR